MAQAQALAMRLPSWRRRWLLIGLLAGFALLWVLSIIDVMRANDIAEPPAD